MAMFVMLLFFSDESRCGENKDCEDSEVLYTPLKAAGNDIGISCLLLNSASIFSRPKVPSFIVYSCWRFS